MLAGLLWLPRQTWAGCVLSPWIRSVEPKQAEMMVPGRQRAESQVVTAASHSGSSGK